MALRASPRALAVGKVEPPFSMECQESKTSMNGARRRVWVGPWIALVSIVLLLLAVLPQRYIPERLAPCVAAKGRFVGDPIRLMTPKSRKPEVAANIRIKMDRGICRGSVQHGSKLTGLFNAREGTCRAQIPTGSELILDPEGQTGDYDVTLGPEWHPLSPKARRSVLLSMAFSMLAVLVLARRGVSALARTKIRRGFVLLAVSVISGLVLYPVLHEGGHMIFGILFGARPNWSGVVWTCLSWEEPHGSFSYLPESAAPFMAAGGHTLPTLAALLLLLIWKLTCKNASWPVSAVLVTLPVLLLLGTLGCLFELYQNTHMDALAVHLELTGPLRVIVSLSPLLVAAAAYAWLGIVYWRSRLETQRYGRSGTKAANG